MTVSATTTRNDYIAAAGQTVFAYTFKALDSTDLVVTKNGVVQSAYSVSGIGVATGGNVTFTSGVTANDAIAIYLAMPVTRDTNYQEGGAFLAGEVNADFDKIYIGAIQNENAIDRSMRLPESEPSVAMTLPIKDDRKGRYLQFNAITGAPEAGNIPHDYFAGTGLDLNNYIFSIDSTVATLSGAQTLTNKTLTGPVIAGPLTTDSTIDGRDVAVDGAKLDTVETNADVTDTTNVTAAGALMDSEVTNLAQVKAFDSTDYATAAQGTTADAALPKAGGTMTGNITLETALNPTLTIKSTDTTVVANEVIGTLEFIGTDDATSGILAGQIQQVAAQGADWGTGNYGSNMSFSIKEAGNGAPFVEKLRLQTSGAVLTGSLNVSGDTSLAGSATISSDLTVSGEITAIGGVAFGDNHKATFGVNDDLQIYHDGTNSRIADRGRGDLSIYGDSLQLNSWTASNNYLTALTGGAVSIYHNGNVKLDTTATGIDVTGTATMDGLTVDGLITATSPVGAPQFTFASSNLSGIPILALKGAASSQIRYIDETDAVQTRLDLTDGGGLNLVNGSGNKKLSVVAGGDISFYEDTGTTPKLFWDASAESLGIGTSSPSKTLTVGGTGLRVFGTASADFYSAGQDALIVNNGTANLRLWNNGSERMRIDSAGNVGIGTTLPERKLHIFNGESGALASNVNSAMVIEDDSNQYISFLSPTFLEAGLLFGDSGDNDSGALTYNHLLDRMSVKAGGVSGVLNIESTGITVNGTSTMSDGVYLGGTGC
jgi:hypothetical protein